MKPFLLAAVSALACALACARAWALDSDIELGQIARQGWTVLNRAPPEVTAFAQTTDGLLWIGSTTGLYWFNGFDFTFFVSGNATLPSYNITALAATADGGLWVGLRSGEAARIHSGEVRTFDERSGLSAGPVHSIVQDQRGVVWLASRGGLFHFDGSRWQRPPRESGVRDGEVTGAFVSRDGTLWFASRDGVFSLPADRQRVHQVLSERFAENGPAHFAQAPDGAIWLSDPERGLLRIVPGSSSGSPQRRLSGKSLNALAFDRDGSLWMGGDRLRRIVSTRRDEVEELSDDGRSSGSTARSIFEDRTGNIWVGTEGGVDRFRHANLVWAITPRLRLASAIVAGPSNRVWAAYSDGSLLTFEAAKLVKRQSAPLFTAAMRDRDGGIWFGGPQAVARLNGAGALNAQLELTPLPPHLRGSPVQTMVRDASGTLWVSVERKGLFRLSGGKWTAAADAGIDEGLPDEAPLVSTLDESGSLWFGYPGDRLVRVSGKTVHVFTARDGLNIGAITALHARGARLWIGGELGLGLLDRTRVPASGMSATGTPAAAFTRMHAVNCQTFMAFTGIVETPSDDLWLFRHSAVSRVDGVSAKLNAMGPDGRLTCRTFGTSEAPAPSARQIRPTPSLVEAEDGRVWLAANEGVAWLDPRRIREDNSLLLTPTLDGVFVGGDRSGDPAGGERMFAAMARDANVLPANPGDLRIQFRVANISSPEATIVRYRLEGQDPSWKFTSATSVFYTNLRPGKYRFVVATWNRRTQHSSEPATMSFIIPPAFYQATWFRVLCGLLGVLLLACLFRIQVRRAGERLRASLEDRMRERERIARELHDTLLQGIQALVLRFQGVAARIPANEPARDMMERALELADDVIAEGRDRVSDLRDSASTPADLSQEIARVGKDLLQESDIRFAVVIDGEPRALHPIVREEGLLIAREAISNAHRHARPRAIEVSLYYERSGLRLGIRDDGYGIDPDVLRAGGRDRHWGLMGMRERATRIRSQLEIWSRIGAGTEIELRVPASVAYRDESARWPWLRFRSRRIADLVARRNAS